MGLNVAEGIREPFIEEPLEALTLDGNEVGELKRLLQSCRTNNVHETRDESPRSLSKELMLIVARQQGALNHTIEGVREQGTHGSVPGYPRRASNVNRRQREFALRVNFV